MTIVAKLSVDPRRGRSKDVTHDREAGPMFALSSLRYLHGQVVHSDGHGRRRPAAQFGRERRQLVRRGASLSDPRAGQSRLRPADPDDFHTVRGHQRRPYSQRSGCASEEMDREPAAGVAGAEGSIISSKADDRRLIQSGYDGAVLPCLVSIGGQGLGGLKSDVALDREADPAVEGLKLRDADRTGFRTAHAEITQAVREVDIIRIKFGQEPCKEYRV
jgi:hypothetical protein